MHSPSLALPVPVMHCVHPGLQGDEFEPRNTDEEKAVRAKLSSIRRAADFAEAAKDERHPLFKIPGGDEERRYNVRSAKSMLAWLIRSCKGVNENTAVTYVKSAVREVSRAADVNILPECSSLKV